MLDRGFFKRMKECQDNYDKEYKIYWKGRPTNNIELMEGESIPIAHQYGDYVKTTSFQRLQFRADKQVGINPKYFYGADPKNDNWQNDQKIYNSHNKWRFIIENVFKIPDDKLDEFRDMYVKYRHVMIECKKYTSLLNEGRNHFYSVTNQTMSDNLLKLEKKKLFYF
jgi:hypothetical protein